MSCKEGADVSSVRKVDEFALPFGVGAKRVLIEHQSFTEGLLVFKIAEFFGSEASSVEAGSP
jgi:hypothetical protein